LAFLTWAATISWPINYGGKPTNSFPSFIVVAIVATILSITLLTLFTFSARAKIFPGKQPEIFHQRATNDRFVMVFEKTKLEGKNEISEIISKYGDIE
jgi:hypothetical protein